MSNHDGSYMLSEVLTLLEERNFFSNMTRKEIKKFLNDIVKIGHNYDCNQGEILESIGESMGICYYCIKFSNDLDDGLCPSCR